MKNTDKRYNMLPPVSSFKAELERYNQSTVLTPFSFTSYQLSKTDRELLKQTKSAYKRLNPTIKNSNQVAVAKQLHDIINKRGANFNLTIIFK